MALITRQLTVDWGITGLAGVSPTLAYHVVDANNADLIARTLVPTGSEFPASSGEYGVKLTTWDTSWGAKVIWDDGTNFASEWIAPDPTLAEIAAASIGAGIGPVAITSDTGPSGTPVEDFLTYQNPQGVGIGGGTVLIYLATDWPGNPANVQAQGATQSDGTWGPLFVNHGTYVAVFNKTAVGGPDVSASFTV